MVKLFTPIMDEIRRMEDLIRDLLIALSQLAGELTRYHWQLEHEAWTHYVDGVLKKNVEDFSRLHSQSCFTQEGAAVFGGGGDHPNQSPADSLPQIQ